MAHDPAARTTIYRTRSARPRLLGPLLALIVFAVPLAVAGHLLGGGEGTVGAAERGRSGAGPGSSPHAGWPAQGQAAIAIRGRRAASPDQQPAPIASLAKVMTAYLTLERYPLSPGEDGFRTTVTAAEARAVAEEAGQGQSVVAVEAGERLTERQLLEALLIPSGNNIARLLAARVAGSEADFVAAMNDEARALGMDHTTYTDPSGFDPGTVSTAADQLRSFRQAMRFPAFRQIVSMPAATLPVAGTLTNFNPLLAEGYAGKTGSDSAAGGWVAFFTRATVGGSPTTVVGVVMGQGEGSDTAALLEAAGDAAEQLVDSAAFRPHIENQIRAGNAAPPKLPGMTDTEPAKELR